MVASSPPLPTAASVPWEAQSTRLRRRLGDVLLDAGVVTDTQLARALEVQASSTPRPRLGAVITQLGLATEWQIAEALGTVLGLDVADLSRVNVDAVLVRQLPHQVAERTGVVLLARSEDWIRVASHDPTNVVALDDIRLYTGVRNVQVVVATEAQVREQLARAWASVEGSNIAEVIDDLDDTSRDDSGESENGDDAPTVRLVSMILAGAVRMGASDIHVEPQRDALRIRYRVDGALRDVMSVPRKATASVVSRMKIISGLDIGERRVPQDGRTRLVVDGGAVDVRVSTLPSMHGEKVVARLLLGSERILPLDQIGMPAEQLTMLRSALEAPQGLVLITGPTGSGKTSTLYAGLSETLDPERNVVAVEDPVEVELPGITQVQVHERAGLTFASALRAVLRQDPDVVLLGEIRDVETASLALRASLTGHLVLSTLHTTSAAGALSRLVDMGMEPFLVASSLSCVVAQRLLRRPCGHCAQPYTPDPHLLARLDVAPADMLLATPRQGVGCSECGDSGYRGRSGAFEVLPVTPELRSLLMSAPDEGTLERAAREAGIPSVRQAALALAHAGSTTYEEVARVTSGAGFL
jgi:type IV pilus assembly protein PilB